MADEDAEELKGQAKVAHELEADERARRREIKDDAELFKMLLKHPAWPRYMEMLEKIGNNFNQRLMTPLQNSFESVKTEFAKGALTGIQACASLPHAKIKEAADLGKSDDGEE